MNNLVLQIKEKMGREGLTPYSLEKSAGLKPNAVHNIISGRSKNPSINVIHTIAKALKCSVSDLIGETQEPVLCTDSEDVSLASNSIKYLDHELYVHCLEYFASLLKKNKCWLSKQKILDCIDEIYIYSYKKGLKQVDKHFAKWFFERART